MSIQATALPPEQHARDQRDSALDRRQITDTAHSGAEHEVHHEY
jgi:hypothetical protein